MGLLNFNNARIAVKIFSIVGVLGLVAGVIAGVGIFALGDMNKAAHQLEIAAEQVAMGADIEVKVMAINRGEYRLAADPSPETIAEVKREFAEQRAKIDEELAEIQASADPEQAKMLEGIGTAITA